MAKNRVIYQSEGLYFSKNLQSTGVGEHAQLRRVQTANYSYEVPKTDVLQYGNLARIGSIVTTTPTVTADFSYLLGDGYNEKVLGFFVSSSGGGGEGNFSSGAIVANSGNNLYIVTAGEGIDLNNEIGASPLSGKGVIGIGNAFISNYEVSAAVGDLPTVNVSVEGLNINSTTYVSNGAITGVVSPAISPASGTPLSLATGTRLPNPNTATGSGIPICLRPGDIKLSFGSFTGTNPNQNNPLVNVDMSSTDSINIQSFSLSLPLSQSAIERLGSKFAFARVVDFPVTATLNVSALVNETVAKNLALAVEDTSTNVITVTINKPGTQDVAIQYTLRGCQLDGESLSSDIGSNKSIDLNFSTQISGPNSLDVGIFCSGSYTGIPFA